MNGDRQQRLQHLTRFLRTIQKPNKPVESIGMNESLVASGLIDSLAMVQIVVYLENTYGIDFAALHPELREQLPGQRASRHPRRGFPGAGPLQDVPGVEPVILEHPDQIGVPRPGPGDAAAAEVSRGSFGRHHVFPIGPVQVPDHHRHRRPDRFPRADPSQPFDPVLLDLHPGAAAVPLHAPGELPVDCLGRYRQTRGKTLDDDDEGLPMRFSGGCKAQSHARELSSRRPSASRG